MVKLLLNLNRKTIKKKEKEIREATIETNTVAWSGDIPLKYQSILKYPVSDERTIKIVGDPSASKNGAMDNLYTELALWQDALAAFDKVLNKSDQ